jgi:hypothetical protein
MKRYTDVHGSQMERPPEIDTQSSPTTVYVRENIRREGEFWVYDETQYSPQEFIQLQSQEIKLLQQVAGKMIQAVIPTTLSTRTAQPEDFKTLAIRFLQEEL